MRSSSDFTLAVRRGRRAGRSSLVIHCHVPAGNGAGSPDPASSSSHPLVGFVVPRSVGTAVARNRVQRRLRHLMRDRVQSLPAGSLLVVRAQPASAKEPDLAPDLDAALAAALRPASGRPAAGGHGTPAASARGGS